MAKPHDYHQPNSPDGSDTEDDLDLQELDPVSASAIGNHDEQTGGSRKERPDRQRYGAGIALRNLRSSARNRIWRRESGASDSRDRDDDDDLESLLADDDGDRDQQRLSQGSSGNDDAPLLRAGRGRRRRFDEDDEGTKLTNLTSKLRLPSFKSGPPADIPQEPESPTSDADDANPKASRQVLVGRYQKTRFPANTISNAKYTPWSFLPRTLYNEFSFFFNMYFLLVALSQIIPVLRIGYMSTYIAPLAFVISITLGKEAYDDIARRRRDAEANSEGYTVLSFSGTPRVPAGQRNGGAVRGVHDSEGQTWHEITRKSRDLKVGDVLKLKKEVTKF